MPDRILSNRYTLESEIGRGGMGVVYKATDSQVKRTVAVKTLPAVMSHNQDLMRRFTSEVQHASKLEHPNIVRVYDVGEDSGAHFYVMQYIDGFDLRSQMKGRGRFSVDETIAIISQVADALDYAHSQGIVHRDIKPENILLDSDGVAHVADFGIAKATEGTRTTRGMLGTPEYMSPEQVKGKSVDGRSDQYSLAVVAYEMLTGRTPFKTKGDDPWAQINMHLNTPVPNPRATVPDIPTHVANALLQALAKTPEQRFGSCEGFVGALCGRLKAAVPTAVKSRVRMMFMFVLAMSVLIVGSVFLHHSMQRRQSKAVSESRIARKQSLEMAYIDNSGSVPVLKSMALDGSGRRTITRLPKGCRLVLFSDDSLWVAYMQGQDVVIHSRASADYHSLPMKDVLFGVPGRYSEFPTDIRQKIEHLASRWKDFESFKARYPDSSYNFELWLAQEDRGANGHGLASIASEGNEIVFRTTGGGGVRKVRVPFKILDAKLLPDKSAAVVVGGSEDENSGNDVVTGIYLVRSSGSFLSLKAFDEVTHASWSLYCCGEHLLYRLSYDTPMKDGPAEMGVVNLKTFEVSSVLSKVDQTYVNEWDDGVPLFTPDKDLAIFSGRNQQGEGIVYAVDLATGKKNQVAQTSAIILGWINSSGSIAALDRELAEQKESHVEHVGLPDGYLMGGNTSADFDGDGSVDTAYWASRNESKQPVAVWLTKDNHVWWRFSCDPKVSGGRLEVFMFRAVDLTNDGQPELVINLACGFSGNWEGNATYAVYVYSYRNRNWVNLMPDTEWSPVILACVDNNDLVLCDSGGLVSYYRWNGHMFSIVRTVNADADDTTSLSETVRKTQQQAQSLDP